MIGVVCGALSSLKMIYVAIIMDTQTSSFYLRSSIRQEASWWMEILPLKLT
jgi:hypothetical protein